MHTQKSSLVNNALVINTSESKFGANNLYMNGAIVADFVKDDVIKSVNTFIENQEIKKNQIDVFVPHQANLELMKYVYNELDLKCPFVNTIGEYGNNGGTSIGIAFFKGLLDYKNEESKINFLISSFGSGPNIVNMFYISNKQEELVEINVNRKSIYQVKWSDENKNMLNPVDLKKIDLVLVEDEIFDDIYREHQDKKILLYSSKEELSEMVKLLIGENIAIASRVENENIILNNTDYRGSDSDNISREKLNYFISRIPIPKYEINSNQFNDKLEKEYAHKDCEDNVLLTMPVKQGEFYIYKMLQKTSEIKFDHQSDHVQGLLLIEAIRQAGISSCHFSGLSLSGTIVLSDLKINYQNYIEKDQPIYIRTLVDKSKIELNKNKVSCHCNFNVFQNDVLCAEGNIIGIIFHSNENWKDIREESKKSISHNSDGLKKTAA